MKLENILAARRAKPFKPFSIDTRSEESFLVTHPENIATHEQASMVLLLFGLGNFAMLDLENITEITFPARTRSNSTDEG